MVEYHKEIKEIEDELKKTIYNKATQHHIGLLKAKMAKIKEKQELRKSSGKKGEGYTVRKSGDASVILVGYPSVGKSTLLNSLTNANSAVASYAFTTLTVIPGMMEYNHAKIQILDVPGIVKGAAEGTGRGKEVLSVIRNSDLVIILLEINQPECLEILKKEVYDTNVRLNQHKPDIKIKKTSRGGVRIGNTVKLTKITRETIIGILKEFRINNADVLIREDITDDQLIDIIEGNKFYIPGIIVLNKIDTVLPENVREIMKKTKADIGISADRKINLESLKKEIFHSLNFIRVYLKEPGKPADLKEPMIMFKGCTLRNICEKLHKDFVSKFKFARVWGKSVKFPGQKILNLENAILDNDVVELHMN